MEIKDLVKEKYGQAALRSGSSCCGASPAVDACDPITSNLYDADQITGLPEQAVHASLGCGNPTALASSLPAKPCSIWAPAAALMCCFRPDASGRRERPMAWI